MSEPPENNPEYREGHGYRSFFWPIILIGVGVVWLLINLGLVQVSSLNYLARFWPVILILVGLDIIFSRRFALIGAILGLLTVGLVVAALLLGGSWLATLPGLGFPISTFNVQDIKSQQFSEPAGNTRSAVIKLDLNRWSTTVTSLSDSPNLVEANVDYVGHFDFNVQGDQEKTVTLGQTGVDGAFLGFLDDSKYRWDIKLNQDIPMELDVNTGSGSNDFRLENLQLTRVTFEGGSGSTKIALPATESVIPVIIQSRSGSFGLTLPSKSNANLDMNGGSGSINFNVGDQSTLTLRWKGASGSQTITIGNGVMLDAQMDTGSGSVTLNLPVDAAVRIEVRDAGSGSITVPSRLQRLAGSGKEGTWESSGYNDAQKRITIVLSTGSGSVSIH
ncbi:MAG: LiaI-LiaF-like domain-containing protein [Anaerolineae bacterium]